jgi:hypothetical protein
MPSRQPAVRPGAHTDAIREAAEVAARDDVTPPPTSTLADNAAIWSACWVAGRSPVFDRARKDREDKMSDTFDIVVAVNGALPTHRQPRLL